MRERLDLLISEAQIRARLPELAGGIAAQYQGQPLTLVVVLKGAAIFAADLVRELTVEMEIEFVRAASYGRELRSSGTVGLSELDRLDVMGRHVLVIEDILDTGGTARVLDAALRRKEPANVAFLPLLRKPAAHALALSVPLVGFDIADDFVVGYGMDYAERHRNLRDIHRLSFTS